MTPIICNESSALEDSLSTRLLSLHEGVPDWFPGTVRHILRLLQGRDRFNLYNINRALASCCPETPLSTQQLREVLQRLAGHGLRFTGSHAQKVILDKCLIQYWSCFLIPVCETSEDDLSVFQSALRGWRFEDMAIHPVMKQFLPPSYRSRTKENLTRHCLRKLFADPGEYRRFVGWQAAHLTPGGAELYRNVEQNPQSARDVICDSQGWAAVYELWNALLIHPSYDTREGRLFLRLAPFRGFAMPFRLPLETSRTKTSPDACLEPIRRITSQLLKGQPVSLSASNCKRTFPERQMDIFREAAGSRLEDIRQMLTWWHDMIGSERISRGALPSRDFLLTCSESGRYVPFVVERYNLELVLTTLLQFGLVTRNDAGHLALSSFGRMFISGAKPELAVKAIWARNVERLSLRLGEGWGEGFRRFLAMVATSNRDGEYLVTPDSLANSEVKTDHALVILSGFSRFDSLQMARLERWTQGH